ncbi:MAG: hypothetical protein GY851_18090 [bacterium]|nr:hypothetical protein [bacterium]
MVRRYEMVAIGVAVLVGLALATWSGRVIGDRAAAAGDFVEGLKPGMPREQVVTHASATLGSKAMITHADDGGMQVIWNFTHKWPDRFILEFREDQLATVKLVNDDLNLHGPRALRFCRQVAEGSPLYFALDATAFTLLATCICCLILGFARWRDRERRGIYFALALIAFAMCFMASLTGTAALAIGS